MRQVLAGSNEIEARLRTRTMSGSARATSDWKPSSPGLRMRSGGEADGNAGGASPRHGVLVTAQVLEVAVDRGRPGRSSGGCQASTASSWSSERTRTVKLGIRSSPHSAGENGSGGSQFAQRVSASAIGVPLTRSGAPRGQFAPRPGGGGR